LDEDIEKLLSPNHEHKEFIQKTLSEYYCRLILLGDPQIPLFEDIKRNLKRAVSKKDPTKPIDICIEGEDHLCDCCFKALSDDWYICIACTDMYEECTDCHVEKENDKESHPHNMGLTHYGLTNFSPDNITYRENRKLTKMNNLLCFDGGGIRGYLTILMFEEYMKNILEKIETENKEEHLLQLLTEHINTKKAKKPGLDEETEKVDFLVKYLLPRKFHLVCGTSIGGIISILLALEIPLSKIKEKFKSNKFDIFPQRWTITKYFQSAKSIVWDGKATYTDEGLRKLFNELTEKIRKKKPDGILTLKDLKLPCAVTSYDLNINSVVYFTNLTQECQNIPIIDAILSTSAAPTYFPIHTFTCDNFEYQCVDGGIWGNDPRIFAFAFQRIFSHARIINIVSFGTGLFQENYISRKGHEDPVSWLRFKPDIISTLMNASTSQVEKIFEYGFRTGLVRHTKLNVTLTTPIDLDDPNSLPLQEKYFNEEKNDRENIKKTMTKFAVNIHEAVRLTWMMGCTTKKEHKERWGPKEPYNISINLSSNRIPKDTQIAPQASTYEWVKNYFSSGQSAPPSV